MITGDGCWADYRIAASAAQGRPCLFLDRDGVLIEDTGYPHDPDAIVLIPETLALVRHANARGHVVGIVSNQSGVGRGYFGWEAFSAVQGAIDAALEALGGGLDFVLACPHIAEASTERYRNAQHPWRKPAPGMLVAAGASLGLNLKASAMLGDRPSDMIAARDAAVGRRALLTEAKTPGQEGDWTSVPRAGLLDWFDESAV